MIIKGIDAEVDAIEKIFKEMVFVINTSGKLTNHDVGTIIELTLEGKEIVSEK